MRAVPEPAALAGKTACTHQQADTGLGESAFWAAIWHWLACPHSGHWQGSMVCMVTVDQKKRPLRKSGAVFGQSAVGLSRSFYFQA